MPGYCRYVDDIFLFGDCRADLRAWRRAVGEWLEQERRLRLKHPAARILSCRGSLDALGYRITRCGFEALPRVLARLCNRVQAHMRGTDEMSESVDLERSLASTAGVVLF